MSQFAYSYLPKSAVPQSRPIKEDNFFKWSNDNMYRTSYNTQWTNKPLEPKNVAVPGYGGFVPGLKSENEFGKSYSRITRENFGKDTLGDNKNRLSSTGFNHKKHVFIDHTRTASTHKYGS